MTTIARFDEDDAFWMRRALAEAGRGEGLVEPNPMVGAVVVKDGRLQAVGHHERFGGPHAEVHALDRAGVEAARGSTLYVTLEPCSHHGKTPPCSEAIARAGVRRVVVATMDPFPKVFGTGITQLRAAGVVVDVGVEEAAARERIAPYLKRLATGRPYVIAKWAMTLDGKIATGNGSSRWITGPRARAHVHELRGRVDAIVVGMGTVLADDPALDARPPGARVALRVVLDPLARTPLDSRLASTARDVPVLIVCTEQAAPDRRAALEVLGCETLALAPSGRVPIPSLLDELGGRGAANVLVEGGGLVLGAFLDAGEIDEAHIYVAPLIEGGDHPNTGARGAGVSSMEAALRLELPTTQVFEDGDVRIVGRLHRPWRDLPAAPAPA